MTEIEKTIGELRKKMPTFKDKYGVKTMGIFGSYATGIYHKRSDVDILVDFEDGVTLFQFLALERELSTIVGRKVDLVMRTALKPRIGQHILSEVKYI